MRNLREVYDAVAPILGDCESFEVAETVEKLRRYWRPAQVNVILLAESHVFTREEELRIALSYETLALTGLPSQFVRFVYCLGYGERLLVSKMLKSNFGTPQFWKIFHNCCYDPSSSLASGILVSRSKFEDRLPTKIDLLKNLQSRGIWLVDASVTALYNRRGNRPKQDAVAQVLTSCWDLYIRQVMKEASPKHIIVIGKGVGGILEARLRADFPSRYTVLPQPQARLSANELRLIAFRYFSICSKFAPPSQLAGVSN